MTVCMAHKQFDLVFTFAGVSHCSSCLPEGETGRHWLESPNLTKAVNLPVPIKCGCSELAPAGSGLLTLTVSDDDGPAYNIEFCEVLEPEARKYFEVSPQRRGRVRRASTSR